MTLTDSTYYEFPDRAVMWLQSKIGPRLSRHGSPQEAVLADLEAFGESQQLARDAVASVAASLEPGVTEIEAADRLDEYVRERGAHNFVHRPFAWFGTHSRFDPYRRHFNDYHPTSQRLEPDDVFILDVSPITDDGYMGDVGYTGCLSPHAGLDEAKAFLDQLRETLPDLFLADLTPAEIWDETARNIESAGYDVCHADYPLRVLGHRIYRFSERQTRKPHGQLIRGPHGQNWFSRLSYGRFLRYGVASELLTPEHVGDVTGAWALEPHIGGQGFGAKFEDFLIVTETSARWIDDELAHRRATEKAETNGS